MEMVSSIISDLPRFVRRRDTLPDVNGGFGRLSLSRYGFQILLRQINLGLFLMVAARRFILAISIPATMSSAMVIRSLGSQRRRQSGSVICP